MKLFTYILCLVSLMAIGQKEPHNHFHSEYNLFLPSHSVNKQLYGSEAELVKQALYELGQFPEYVKLELTHQISSKAFTHYTFDIYVEGSQLWANPIKAAVSRSGKMSATIPQIPVSFRGRFPEKGISNQIKTSIGAENIVEVKEILISGNSDELIRALRVELSGPETLHQEIIYSEGEVVYRQDLHKYLNGPSDTSVSVLVFDPDPLTTAEVNYGAPYHDNGDRHSKKLDDQRQLRTTTFSYSNGMFLAENDFVKIADFSLPSIPALTSTSNQLFFTRDSASFEDVNVMYHITQHKEHLIRLGFPMLPSYQIQVDAHALSGSDQSFFSTNAQPYRLYFGEGGVDDAEDADVIIHEYSHAVIFEASPSWSVSTERGCVEEAICDYFAASYSKSVSEYNYANLFSWDSGEGEFWPGRSVQSTKNYTAVSFKNGSYYTNTDLLASCLMAINGKLGRDLTDELVLEGLFFLTANSSMPDFAGFLLKSDSALYGGIHTNDITNAFATHVIQPQISLREVNTNSSPDGINIHNTHGFAQGQALHIDASGSRLSEYKLFNSAGQLIAQSNLKGEYEYSLNLPDLQSGVYILQLTTQDGISRNFRLSRN